MADPIMDLFEDTPLFNLDALPDDSFAQGSSDPVEEALKLALGQVDPPADSELTVNTGLGDPVVASVLSDPVQVATQQPVPVMAPQTVSIASAPSVTPVSVEALPQIQVQTSIPVVSNTSVATSSTVLLSSPLTVSSASATTTATTQLTQITQQLTPQQLAAITQQAGGKIVILKGPQGQAQVLQTVSGATSQAGGKVIRVLSGTPLKPGMSILQGGTVLNQPGQAQIKAGTTGVQRVLQSPNGPVKQVLLTSVPQQAQGQAVQVQIPAQATIDQGQNQVQIQPQGQIQVQPQAQATQIQVQATGQVQLQPAMQAQTAVSAPTSATDGRRDLVSSTVVFWFQFFPDFLSPSVLIQGGEAKRITLVLQPPHQPGSVPGQAGTLQQQVTQIQQVQTGQAGQQQAPAKLVLGQLPGGKLVLQGSQLAALTQARAGGQAGGQPKVLTIQLQVQQQPNQQGGVKVRLRCL